MTSTATRTSVRFFLLLTLTISCSIHSHAQDTAPRIQVPAEKLASYVGQYQYDDNPTYPLSISLSAGKLFAESMRSPHQELLPESQNTFIPLNNPTPATFRFILDANGKVAALLRIAADKSTRHAKKISDLPQTFTKPEFLREDAMIPVRDGVKLHAVILTPKGPNDHPLPILMERTPYGVDDFNSDSLNNRYPELVHDNYIFVFQDIRGRYKSEGAFVMSRAMVDHSNPKLVDESTDTYDPVAWLVKNLANNNGRVGVFGISYPGFLAQAAGIDPHPAVKAISPQAPMIDVWMGDDFFHNGAFRQTYGYDYVYGMESSKEQTNVDYGKDKDGKARDGFDYFLERGSFAEDVKKSGSKMLPTWKLFLEHPAYDSYWSSRGVEHSMNAVTVPTLTVGGTYDQEDMFGPQIEYATLEPHDTHHENFMVLG